MYGKWFDSAYTGSMAGAGADVFAVMAYAVAHADREIVELNPVVVAGLIGMPVENVVKAIEFLCQPDPKSRNPEHEGRRLLYQSGYRYELASFRIYRAMRDTEARRDYMRGKQQEQRDKKKKKASTTVNHRQPKINRHQPPLAEAEAEAEEEEKKAPRSGARVFSPNGTESPAAGFSSPNDDATNIARAVVDELGFGSTWEYDVLFKNAKIELTTTANSPDQIKTGMVEAWQEYQRCATAGKLARPPGSPSSFFTGGKWKNWKLWGLKKGESAWS